MSKDLATQNVPLDASRANHVDELLAVPADASDEELLELGVQAYTNSVMWMARSGRCFQRVRDQWKKNQSVNVDTLAEHVEARGVDRNKFYRAIRVSEYLETLPIDKVKRLLRVAPCKVLELARADQEVVDDLLEEGAIDGESPLSVRDLRVRLTRERANHEQTHYALEDANRRIQELERERDERNQRNPLPPWYRYLRNDVHASTEAMAQQIAELERLANEWVIGASRATENDESLARMAAGSVYHNLAGVVAQGQAVLKRLVQSCGEEIASEDDLLLLRADDDELQHLARNRAQIIRDIEADKAARRHARETEHLNKPRGRGRPTGSKDKKPRQRREG